MSIDFDGLGDHQKKFELEAAGRVLMPGIPVLARLDGRHFSTFTAGLKRPFDDRLTLCMQETAKALMHEFACDLAYTQSDEITLCWLNRDVTSQVIFGGRFQKICSSLAASASVRFNVEVRTNIRGYEQRVPTFDCRVWQVPNLKVAAENFLWREMDATKNSVSMAISSYEPHRGVLGLKTKERKQLLLEKHNVVWEDYPNSFKRGTYFKKFKEEKFLTQEELSMIPSKYRPGGKVFRSVIRELCFPKATSVTNLADVLFLDKPPVIAEGKVDAY